MNSDLNLQVNSLTTTGVPTSLDIVPKSFPGGQDLISNKGFCIGARGQALLRLETDTHIVTMGKTGSGKGRSVVIPNLLLHEGSVFTTEISGDNVRKTLTYRKHILGQDVYVLDPLYAIEDLAEEYRASFNILDSLDPSKPSFYGDADKIATSICQGFKGERMQDVYWENAPVKLLTSLILYVKTSWAVKDENRNFPYIVELLSKAGTKEWQRLMIRFAVDSSEYKISLNETGNHFLKENDNTNSILSVAKSFTKFAENPAMAKYMRSSSFDLKDLRAKKCTIYFVMPNAEDYKTYSTWIRLIVEQAMRSCPSIGELKEGKLQNQDRILFLLDEFSQLGKLDAVDQGMQTARHKGITLWCIFQDFNRLKEAYGENLAHSFLGAADCIQAFGIGDLPTAEVLTKYLGDRIAFIPTIQEGINWSDGTNQTIGNTVTHSQGTNWTKGTSTSETESWSTSITNGSSYNTGFSGSDYSNSSGGNSSYTTQNGHASAIGRHETIGANQGDSISDQKSSAYSRNEGGQYSISYTPHILPALQPSKIIDMTCNLEENVQILFVRNKGYKIIDGRANYDKIKFLQERVEGLKFKVPPLSPNQVEPLENLEGFSSRLELPKLEEFPEFEKLKTYMDINVDLDSCRKYNAQLTFSFSDILNQLRNSINSCSSTLNEKDFSKKIDFTEIKIAFNEFENKLVLLVDTTVDFWKSIALMRSKTLGLFNFIKKYREQIENEKLEEFKNYQTKLNSYACKLKKRVSEINQYRQLLKEYKDFLLRYKKDRDSGFYSSFKQQISPPTRDFSEVVEGIQLYNFDSLPLRKLDTELSNISINNTTQFINQSNSEYLIGNDKDNDKWLKLNNFLNNIQKVICEYIFQVRKLIKNNFQAYLKIRKEYFINKSIDIFYTFCISFSAILVFCIIPTAIIEFIKFKVGTSWDGPLPAGGYFTFQDGITNIRNVIFGATFFLSVVFFLIIMSTVFYDSETTTKKIHFKVSQIINNIKLEIGKTISIVHSDSILDLTSNQRQEDINRLKNIHSSLVEELNYLQNLQQDVDNSLLEMSTHREYLIKVKNACDAEEQRLLIEMCSWEIWQEFK